MTLDEVTEALSQTYGKGFYHAKAIYKEVFKQGNFTFDHLEEFAKSGDFASRLASDIIQPSEEIIETIEDDGVCKFATKLHDGNIIESVIIPHPGRNTLCISSQVGCKLACSFCSTGTMGFIRNLTTAEIVTQLFYARFKLKREIRNIVFMGMGEPMHNLDAVIQAIKIFGDPRGFDIPPKQVSVSTAGDIAGLERIAKADLPNLKIAISLHSADDLVRTKLMPINNKYPLEKLRQALLDYPLKKKEDFLIEYTLLPGINDSMDDVHKLKAYLEGIPCRVNIIPYNPGVDGEFKRPTDDDLLRFHGWLVEAGLFALVRTSKGENIAAACGQLRKELEK